MNEIAKQTAKHVPFILLTGVAICACAIVLLCTPVAVVTGFRLFLSRYVLNSAYLIVKSQPVGTPFIIESARLKKPGYIVPILGDYYDTPHIQKIGVSNILYAGEYKSEISIDIELAFLEDIFRDKKLQDVDKRNNGHPIFVVVLYDNGDGIFSLESDPVAKDMFGMPMIYKVEVK